MRRGFVLEETIYCPRVKPNARFGFLTRRCSLRRVLSLYNLHATASANKKGHLSLYSESLGMSSSA